MRAGLHHGPVLRRHHDLFGSTVNLASRVTTQAAGGQVLATPIGAVRLRSLPDPVELYELALPATHDRVVDPVCRMAVDRATAPGRLTLAGHGHWLCSLACAAAFAANPDRYTTQEPEQ